MGAPDPILDELITYLRWPVKRTPESYQIEFDYDDYMARRINGLSFSETNTHQTEGRPLIDGTNAFDAVPLSFRMTQSGMITVYYHTLAGQLHRIGKPAKYQILEKGVFPGNVKLSYFEHGHRHRDGGPAMVEMDLFKPFAVTNEETEVHGRLGIHTNTMKLEWYTRGESGALPGPSRASLTNVRLLYDEQGRYSDFGDQKALRAGSAVWNWSTRYEDPTELHPSRLVITDLEESYEENVLKSRIGQIRESTWFRGPHVSVMLNFPSNYLLNEVNLWSGPFADAMASIKIEDEFRKHVP
jgi:hypothetical protein